MKNIARRQWRMGSVHLLVLVLVYALPFVFELSEGRGWHHSHRMMFFQSFSVAVFYVNYFVLVPRFLLRRRTWLYLVVNALLFVLLSVIIDRIFSVYFAFGPADGGPAFPPPGRALRLTHVFRPVLSFIIAAGLGVAARMTENWFHSEARRKELEKSHLESELNHLKLQLNPHFFFNTLNSIYALIQQDPPQAQVAVHELSRLMRYLLHGSETPAVPLEREVVFLRNYVSLMRLRLPATVPVTVELPDDTEGMAIAPLLFISLVDNAFKHGIGAQHDPFVTIRLQVDGGLVRLAVENSLAPQTEERKAGSGIGLANLRKRLELIYPGRFLLRTGPEDGVYRALLEVRV